jgi:hypothetical protein
MGTDRTVTLAATARTRTPKMAKVEVRKVTLLIGDQMLTYVKTRN